ncbi:ABC transporter permease [Prosthecobacter sp.]|uniref:ABC transporter permease n=1 Tax=Prosthecobacter sp. TaxID=1965333 RepID=UPI0037848D53
MNLRIISALVMRYLFLYSRTPMRLVELIKFGEFILFFLGAMILWDILFRAQQGVAISFLEDVWTRNLLNVFVAPVRTAEYLGATFVVGFLRILVTCCVMSLISYIGYSFNIFQLQWWLIPFFLNLMVFGWALGMISTALILRWGQAAESLAWAVPFFIQPVVCVFYPVENMPAWAQPIAWLFPATPIFEGMRSVMKTGVLNWDHLWLAAGLNLIYLTLAGWLFVWVLNLTRKRGLLTKFATQ